MSEPSSRHLVLVAFDDEAPLVEAVRKLRASGVDDVDTLSPIDVAAADVKWRTSGKAVALACLLAGLFGLVLSYGIQWWVNVVAYPLDVGGRPLDSAPAFIPLTFEGTVLCAAFGAFFAFLWSARLPKLADPAFAFVESARLTRDRFALFFIADVETWERVRLLVDAMKPAHVELVEAKR